MVVIPAASAGFGVELPAAIGLLVIPLCGALVGFVNGFLIVKLKLNAFIVTLAMLTVLRGVQVGSTKGKTLFNLPDSFTNLATTTFLGLPMSVWLAALLVRRRRLGAALPPRRPRAVRDRRQPRSRAGGRCPGGPDRVGGVRRRRVLAAIGGLAYTGYVGALGANQGSGMIFRCSRRR